jgi:hypothetical protein
VRLEEEEAVEKVACPTCGARAGVSCMDTGNGVHPRRIRRLRNVGLIKAVHEAKATRKEEGKGKRKSRSVRAVPGGAFESNRRRH